MKKYLLLILVSCIGIVSSCKYDDGELWDNVDDLANRISAIETLTQQKNSDIAAMKAIITALENQVSVSEVEKLTDGYILHFTDGTTATIKNGVDGTDGEEGNGGIQAPVVGLSQVDGVYYWTLTIDGKTEWLTDETGSKLPVITPATDGVDGAPGKDGRTPTLKIDKEGFWMVSYDGTNFDYIKGQNDEKISALSQNGANGVAKFSEVIVDEKEEKLTIVMNDDAKTTYVLPIAKKIAFFLDQDCKEPVDIKNIEWDGTDEIVLFYRLQLDNAKYDFVSEDNIKAQVDEENKSVTLLLQSNVMAELRAVLLFFNETQTLTSVFKFKVAPWGGVEDVSAVEPENGVYEIYTPAELAWVAQMVNEGENITFKDETVVLMNDINLGNLPWKPIGESSVSPFEGTFKGNGKTIRGLSVDDGVVNSKSFSRTTPIKGAGLFGVVKGATLEDVTIADAVVKSSEATGTGVLVGCALDAVTISGVTITQEETSGAEEKKTEVQGNQNVGTVAGYISASEIVIENCSVTTSNVSTSSDTTSSGEAASVGGVVGALNVNNPESGTPSVKIDNCNVSGIQLSTSTESEGSSSNTAAGGVIGSLVVEDDVKNSVSDLSSVIEITNNTVTDTQLGDSSSEGGSGTENAESATQGAVVGNLKDLDASVASGIISKNEVSEEVQIETQLTVNNLGGVLESVLNDPALQTDTLTFNVKGTNAATVKVPVKGVGVTLYFDEVKSTANNPLVIVQGEEGTVAGISTEKIKVAIPYDEANKQYLTLTAPKTTVTLAEGYYAIVRSLTAKNTLIVEEGVVIEKLIVEDGSVQVFGTVNSIERAENSTASISVDIEEGGSVGNADELAQQEGFTVNHNYYRGDFVDEQNGTYTIYTVNGWKEFAAMVNGGNDFAGKTVRLGADIDLQNELQEPIGMDDNVYFAGTLDGKNHAIKNFKVDKSTGKYAGLFARLNGATIQNLRMVGGSVKGSGTTNYVGALAGYGRGVIIINCHNEGCSILQVSEQNNGYSGGIIGGINKISDEQSTVIIACTNSAEVSGTYCPSGITGGGFSANSSIVACVNTGKISYSGTNMGETVYAAGISGNYGSVNFMYGCFTDCEVVPGSTHGSLVADAGTSHPNLHYSYSANTSIPLLGQVWGIANKTIAHSSYNDAVENLNKGIQQYNWKAIVPCAYQFVKGDKPTLVAAEVSTNPGSGTNNFGNGGNF